MLFSMSCFFYAVGYAHRIGRVPSCFSSRRNWDSPNPSSAGERPTPALWFRGEGHTRWRERGWESPNSNEGTYTVALYIHVLCGYAAISTAPYKGNRSSITKTHLFCAKGNTLLCLKWWMSVENPRINWFYLHSYLSICAVGLKLVQLSHDTVPLSSQCFFLS